MGNTYTPENFISAIAPIIRREAFSRGYKYPSAIIAQACIESRYGNSGLAGYNNFFGLKCGKYWTGRSVNMQTKEEYTAGVLTNISANFRAYDSMESGVIGYFDFIDTSRYKNLLQAESAYNYLEIIKQDGYATSSRYVSNVYAVVEQWDLLKYDWQSIPDEPEEESAIVSKPPSIEFDIMLDASIEVIAMYVIKGFFGNGHEVRSKAIYDIIKKRVNDIIKKESDVL